MKTILHVTCDFPDPMVGAKTRSVQNLVENTPEYRHVVYSLNRANWKTGVHALRFGADRTALSYGAPPKGLYHATRLKPVADWILADVRAQGIQPDVIHAHKMTVEGLIALDLTKALGAPYVVDIWADTDLKIAGARKDLGPKWRQVLADAAAVFPCAPWATDKFEAGYGLDRTKATVLPPIVWHDTFYGVSKPAGAPRFVSLFNLDVHKRKNFEGLVQAIMEVAKTVPDITLDLWGKGGPEAINEVAGIIAAAGAENRVFMKGPLPEGEFESILNGYVAFVMPTLRETFGMVFIESLFSGLPILYTREWSVDGLFEHGQVGYACRSHDNADVQAALKYLLAEEARLKTDIAKLHADGGLDPYKRAGVVATYRGVIEKVTGG
ncbi:glycosyltransferase family 4 protein [Phenylobacterium sp.]|uniref:glycosyltransferase family 4 protein n=1 Tax=Phenylobacterium sp. TaxID=1871053 RepID=UPI003D26EFDA